MEWTCNLSTTEILRVKEWVEFNDESEFCLTVSVSDVTRN